MLPDDMVLTLAPFRPTLTNSVPALTNGIKTVCWQYSKILVLGWRIMYRNGEYVFESQSWQGRAFEKS